MKIGFVSLGMGAYSLQDALAVGVAAGCEAMELNGRATVHQNLWAPPIDYGYFNPAQPTDEALAAQVQQFVGYCDVARQMGIPIVRAFAGDVLEGCTLDALYPRLVAGFKAVTAQAAGWGLSIGIENHGRLINNGDLLAGLLHDVGSPILGITLDTGNFCWAGHSIETAHRFFEKLLPFVVNVHIKDGCFAQSEFELLPAGRGDIGLASLFKMLAGAGYDGPVLSEYEGKADFRASTIESVAYLRGLRDALA
jgi:sugar phosphate isomerase/epimerase